MKSRLIYLSIVLILSSSFTFNKINSSEDLQLFIKTWNLIRFRLPDNPEALEEIDTQAFSGIKTILSVQNRMVLNNQINKLLRIIPDSARLFTDLKPGCQGNLIVSGQWILSGRLNKNNQQRLQNILLSQPKKTPSSVYLDASGIPVIKSSRFGKKLEFSSTSAVFCVGLLWSYVDYFYPYKNILLWNSELEKAIAKSIAVNSERELDWLLMSMLEKIKDGHARIESERLISYWGYYRLPFDIQTESNSKPIINKIYSTENQDFDIKIDDIVISIDGKKFSDFYEKYSMFFSGNQQVKRSKAISKYLLVPKNDPVEIILIRDGKIISRNLTPIPRFRSKKISASKQNLTDPILYFGDTISYLNLNLIEETDFRHYYDSIKHSQAAIIDLREYPNNLLDTLANYFFNKSYTIAEYYKPSLTYLGFSCGPLYDEIGNKNSHSYRGSLFVLVNGNTFSRGEYIAQTLQSLPNTITVGTPTSGTDGDILSFNLPFGIKGSFTTIKISYPNGKSTHNNGINIDWKFPDEVSTKIGFDPELLECVSNLRMKWSMLPNCKKKSAN